MSSQMIYPYSANFRRFYALTSGAAARHGLMEALWRHMGKSAKVPETMAGTPRVSHVNRSQIGVEGIPATRERQLLVPLGAVRAHVLAAGVGRCAHERVGERVEDQGRDLASFVLYSTGNTFARKA